MYYVTTFHVGNVYNLVRCKFLTMSLGRLILVEKGFIGVCIYPLLDFGWISECVHDLSRSLCVYVLAMLYLTVNVSILL